ncbi:MAG: hypothetical protein ACJ71I_17310 [Nitrososphaeraceae archaeon]
MKIGFVIAAALIIVTAASLGIQNAMAKEYHGKLVMTMAVVMQS